MPAATDWDRYYARVPPTARLTRRYSASILLGILKRYALTPAREPLCIVEIGGANSFIAERIVAEIPCRAYHAVDTNRYGLSLLEAKTLAAKTALAGVLHLHRQSVLALDLDLQADVVFSVGLIEHFAPAETRQAVLNHFRLLRPGGILILTFPTPTLLYRMTRTVIERAGQWQFPDERPLLLQEVAAAIGDHGSILHRQTLWPLLLTQELMVVRKQARLAT